MTYKLLFILALVLLSGCRQTQSTQSQDKIDISDQLVKCIVFFDHIECLLTNGRIYFAYQTKINEVTKWDRSAWANQS